MKLGESQGPPKPTASAGDVTEVTRGQNGAGGPHPIVRRKSGMIGKKFPSLQVSHYPVLLLSNSSSTSDATNPHPSVTWRTRLQLGNRNMCKDIPVHQQSSDYTENRDPQCLRYLKK
uniref:Uncharacterized protein n=1 Tax=Caenorhabditis japonica TaxID=281687 RepID=A0A8R1DW41_CAEJA